MWGGGIQVSPGLTLRPSLSALSADESEPGRGGQVSPGLTLRPSLSVGRRIRDELLAVGVAGVDAPAFVERSTPYRRYRETWKVSPGLTLRPSLSV